VHVSRLAGAGWRVQDDGDRLCIHNDSDGLLFLLGLAWHVPVLGPLRPQRSWIHSSIRTRWNFQILPWPVPATMQSGGISPWLAICEILAKPTPSFLAT